MGDRKVNIESYCGMEILTWNHMEGSNNSIVSYGRCTDYTLSLLEAKNLTLSLMGDRKVNIEH
jgi:hypothetical protein